MMIRNTLLLFLLLLFVTTPPVVVQSIQLGYCQLGCYKDSDCIDGLQCSIEHANELQQIGLSSNRADCYLRSTFQDEFNNNNAGVCYTLKKIGGGFGDPHFTTWDGTHYTFHGSCDLIMVSSQQFGYNTTSFDVHIRTDTVTPDATWSLISNAAVQIGNDIIIELANDGSHSINRIDHFDLPYTFHIANQTYLISRTEDIVPETNDIQTYLRIENQNTAEHIQFNLYKKMISVHIDATIPDTYGMLGYYHIPGMIGRDDPNTVLTDPIRMGMSWQVRDSDPFLFRTKYGPQYPEQQCRMPPSITSSGALQQQQRGRRRRRRLGRSIEQINAEKACARVTNPTVRQFCMDDVLITGDIHIAHAYITPTSPSIGYTF